MRTGTLSFFLVGLVNFLLLSWFHRKKCYLLIISEYLKLYCVIIYFFYYKCYHNWLWATSRICVAGVHDCVDVLSTISRHSLSYSSAGQHCKQNIAPLTLLARDKLWCWKAGAGVQACVCCVFVTQQTSASWNEAVMTLQLIWLIETCGSKLDCLGEIAMTIYHPQIDHGQTWCN